MAMDLELFVRRTHTLLQESLGYNVNLFNEATGGAILISTVGSGKMAGGYTEDSLFAYVDNLIRRRDPAGNADLTLKQLSNKLDNAVRLAYTTELLDLSGHWWDWIGRDNATAASVFAKMLSEQTLQGYVRRAVTILKATVASNPATFRDAVTDTDATRRGISYRNLILTAAKFGDQSGQLGAWLMPSMSRTELLLNNLQNTQGLFTFGTVNVARDPEGRIFVTTDDPALTETVSSDVNNYIFGLRRGAILMSEQDDFEDLTAKTGGKENIKKTYQAQWSQKVDVYGYKYNISTLQSSEYASPSDAAIATPANWTQVTNNHKETAGVALRVRQIL